MTMLKITKDELCQMLAMQLDLNRIYTGADWRGKTRLSEFFAATDAEWAEFLEETTSLWKWYGNNRVYNRSKALMELVDVTKFAMSMALYENTPQQFTDIDQDEFVLNSVSETETRFAGLVGAKTYFMTRVLNRTVDLIDLTELILHGCNVLDYTIGEFIYAFGLKNEICKKRVAGGVLEGTYDKSQEQPITI